jgi:aspartyl aminopeptidase
LKSSVIVGLHSDSPSLLIPTDSDFDSTFHQIDILHYSGGLSYSWFERDLKLVGSIKVKRNEIEIEQIVISDTKPIAFIPAPPSFYKPTVSMDRKTAFRPIFGEIGSMKIKDYISKITNVEADQIVSMDLRFTDCYPASLISDFISSGRLDDLVCTYANLSSFLNSKPDSHISIIAVFDHEEIGSRTFVGAKSQFLSKVIEFLCSGYGLNYESFKAKSFLFLLIWDFFHIQILEHIMIM